MTVDAGDGPIGLDRPDHLSAVAALAVARRLAGHRGRRAPTEVAPTLKWSTDAEGVISRLRSYGVDHIAITRDGDPILAHTAGVTSELPVMPIQPVDTLGAGDIFHGAFCHYLLENDFLRSLERAGEVASLSCTSLGTRAWIEQAKCA